MTKWAKFSENSREKFKEKYQSWKNYLDKELKKLSLLKIPVVCITVGSLGMTAKSLAKGYKKWDNQNYHDNDSTE